MNVTLLVIVPVCVIGAIYHKRKTIEGSPIQEQLLISDKLMKFDQEILRGVIPRIVSKKPLLNLQTVSFYKGNAKKKTNEEPAAMEENQYLYALFDSSGV